MYIKKKNYYFCLFGVMGTFLLNLNLAEALETPNSLDKKVELNFLKKLPESSSMSLPLATETINQGNLETSNKKDLSLSPLSTSSQSSFVASDKGQVLDMPILAAGPVALVRYLASIHDEVTINEPGAELKLRKALLKAGEEMLNYPITVWNDAENFYALMNYLFIGGNPNIVQALIKDADKDAIPKNVLEGSLAYAYRDTEVFLKSFDDAFFFDQNIPQDLRMAACLGTALEDALDPKIALKRLDLVRTAVPGSLLEEAALRREALLAHYGSDKELLKLLAYDYMTRFSKSPYEKMFWHAYAVSMVRLAPQLTDSEIEDALQFVPLDMRYIILSHISRSFLVSNNLQRAHTIAEKAIRLATYEHFPSDAVRFYYAASSIGSIEIFQAKKILDTIDIDNLSMRDRALFIACLTLEQGIIKNNHLAPLGENETIAQMNSEERALVLSNVDGKGIIPFEMDEAAASEEVPTAPSNRPLDSEVESYLNSIKLPVPKMPHITDIMIDRENKKIEDFLSNAQAQVKALETEVGGG